MGGANAENSTLIKSGAGVLTLSASSTFTFTIPATGTAALRGSNGSSGRVGFFTDANTVDGDGGMTFNSGTDTLTVAKIAVTGDLTTTGTFRTGAGHIWDFGGFVSGTPGTATGVLFVNVGGVEYQIPVDPV